MHAAISIMICFGSEILTDTNDTIRGPFKTQFDYDKSLIRRPVIIAGAAGGAAPSRARCNSAYLLAESRDLCALSSVN